MRIPLTLFRLPIIGKYIMKEVVRIEGGEKESIILRQYMEEIHKVTVDIYTYGGCFAPSFNTGGTVIIGR